MAERGLDRWCIDAFGESLDTLTPKTVAAYQHKVTSLAVWALERNIVHPEELTTLTLRSFLSEALRNGSRSTAAVCVAAMKRYFKWAVREGIIPTDICKSVKVGNPYRGLPRSLNKSILEKLLCPDEIEPYSLERIRGDAIVELIYGSGLNATEVSMLRVGDLDLKRKQVSVERGRYEDKQQVWLPITEMAVLALSRYLTETLAHKAPGDTSLFFNFRGGPLTARSVDYLIKTRSEGRATTGMLRATCAIHLVDGGCGIRAVQEIMGFQSISTAERYQRASAQKLKLELTEFHPRG